MTPPDHALVARGWTPTRLVALIWRLLADLAQARGYTVAQMARHYCLPDRPWMDTVKPQTPAQDGASLGRRVPPHTPP